MYNNLYRLAEICFIAGLLRFVQSGKWLHFTMPRAETDAADSPTSRACPFCDNSATIVCICIFQSQVRPPRRERTWCWPSYVKQSSVPALFALLNMVAPDCHRFCSVHRCEVGAVRMPRNRCHHSPERHRSVTGRLDRTRLLFFSSFLFQFVL